MTKAAFDKIAAGLNDAIAWAQGDTTRGRLTVPIDVRAIRQGTEKTQAEFAATYHIPLGTLRDWEQDRSLPDAPARTLLRLIGKDPVVIARMLAEVEQASSQQGAGDCAQLPCR